MRDKHDFFRLESTLDRDGVHFANRARELKIYAVQDPHRFGRDEIAGCDADVRPGHW